MRKQIYLALVHYPVYNKRREVVCTSVTNFDIHDISRTCSTYDIKGYRLVVPADAQKKLTERILGYWQEGFGGNYNKDREEAFLRTRVAESIEEVIQEIENVEGKRPKIVTTSARCFPNTISFLLCRRSYLKRKSSLIYYCLEQVGDLPMKSWQCRIIFWNLFEQMQSTTTYP